MNACDRLQSCRFFNETVKDMPAVAEMMKRRDCFGEFEKCARIFASDRLGAGNVPPDLAPNDMRRVEALLAELDGTSKR